MYTLHFSYHYTSIPKGSLNKGYGKDNNEIVLKQRNQTNYILSLVSSLL